MNVLVVGGAGYVGGAITDIFMQCNHYVRVYDALLYEESYRKQVDFVYGDVRERSKLLQHLKWADVVIWLAALVGDGACALNPEISVEVNQESVKWLSENYDGRIVFMSTCSVYGAQDIVLDESMPTGPLSVYAVTKLAAENYLKSKNAIIFRLGTLFGVGDRFSRIRLDLVVNTLAVKAHRHGIISVFGGNQFRPLLHVKDAARAVVENILTTHTGVYNLLKQNVRISDLAYQVRNHFQDVVIEQTEVEFQDSRNYRVSGEKSHRVLGFKAIHSIDEGIEDIKELLITERLKDVDNVRYANHAFLSTYNTHKLAEDVV